jgi:hypothetical protein
MSTEHYYGNFPNLGFVGATLSEEEVSTIKAEIADIQANFDTAEQIHHSHAGNIKKEYTLTKSLPAIFDAVVPLVTEYQKVFDFGLKGEHQYAISTAWVNFQIKHEFFTGHTHQGLFSFALWVQVPYTIAEEQEYCSTQDKYINTIPSFNFHYTDALGRIRPWVIPVDSTFENKIVVFPGPMTHSVNPFYSSDGYRIAVSGNIDYA